MPFYRFMKSKFIDGRVAGKLRFSRLIQYRLMEKVFQDQWIGDAEEGRAITYIDYLKLTPGNHDPIIVEQLNRIATAIQPSASVTIENFAYHDRVDCFVFCFSESLLDKLKEVWCDKHPEFGYNGCVAILDPSALARAILERGRIAGKLINEDFRVEVGSVAYEPYDKDFLKAGFNSASPFRKRPIYKEQSEVRIVLFPLKRIDGDFLNVEIDSPEGLIKEVFRDKEMALKVIKEVLCAWDAEYVSDAETEWNSPKTQSQFSTLANQNASHDQRQAARDLIQAAWDKRQAASEIQREKQAEFFEKYNRQHLIEAYWTLRECNAVQEFREAGLQSDKVDNRIADNYPAWALVNQLRNFLKDLEKYESQTSCGIIP